MKRIFILMLGVVISSCSLFLSEEDIAKSNIENELVPSLRNPDSYVFIEIEPVTEKNEKQEFKDKIRSEKYSLQYLVNDIEYMERGGEEWSKASWEKKELEDEIEKMNREYMFMTNSGKSWKQAILHYRAENGFGGMAKGSVVAKLDEELNVIQLEDVSDIYEGF